MLVEACEYRANFLHLRPQQAAILGIEPDHFDCYDSLEQIEAAFRQFAASVPPDGLLLVRHDCASTRRATAGLPCRVESFGLVPRRRLVGPASSTRRSDGRDSGFRDSPFRPAGCARCGCRCPAGTTC